MGLLVFYVALALVVSFICSLLEAALLSTTPSYVRLLARENPGAAARMKRLKDDIDRPLAAILTLNTVAHTFGAAGAGAQAAIVFGSGAVGVFSAVLTLAILLLTEIIPKTVGATYWRGLAPVVTRVLPALILAMYPFVLLSQAMSKLLTRGEQEAFDRDELVALADVGAEQGAIEDRERRLLEHLLRFRTLSARDVMTPRTVVVAYPEETPVAEAVRQGLPFSRIPVYAGNRDHITGYVLEDEVLTARSDGREATPLSALRRDVLTVPESLPLPDLFDRLLARREHISLVVDEYGGTAGVATMEDVVETLLGLEIMDEADRTVDMQQLARQRWARRAARLGLVAEDGMPDPADSLPALLSDDPEGAGHLLSTMHDDPAEGRAEPERQAVARAGITGGEPPAEVREEEAGGQP